MSRTNRKNAEDPWWWNPNDPRNCRWGRREWRCMWSFKHMNYRYALSKKGVDGHNVKRCHYRYIRARKDGSGKLDTYSEIGDSAHNNKASKRLASKMTRNIAKRMIAKELNNDD